MRDKSGILTIVKTPTPDLLVDVKLRHNGKTVAGRTKVVSDKVGRAAGECLADFFRKGVFR